MENVTIRKSDVAMMAVRELNYEPDGELLFAVPPKPSTPVASPSATLTIQLPVGLTPEAFIAYLKELFPPSFGMVVQPEPSDMDEVEFLSYSLELHRAGHTTPATRLTEEQLEEIESERIGAEFSTKPWNW